MIPDACVFCPPLVSREVLVETPHASALWSKGGRSLLVVPRAHRTTPFDLTPLEWTAIHDLLRTARDFVAEKPCGWNIGWNVGSVAGQEIDHVHCHLIPRYADEPYAGRGLRWWFKQPENQRPGQARPVGRRG